MGIAYRDAEGQADGQALADVRHYDEGALPTVT